MPALPTANRADAVLLIRLGQGQYGLPLACVERVLPMAAVLALPESTETLVGMLNLHGNVLPVVDPRVRLGVPRPRLCVDQRLVLIGGANPFLLWVDDVQEVVQLTPDELSSVPAQQASPLVPRVARIGHELVPLLAPAALEPRAFGR